MTKNVTKHSTCEWCKKPMDPEKHIKTGFSKEHICLECADKADSMGYDTNEL